jgi:hypothetical protein
VPDEHHQALPARHARVYQVRLQHRVVLDADAEAHVVDLPHKARIARYIGARMAASLRSTRPVAKAVLPNR